MNLENKYIYQLSTGQGVPKRMLLLLGFEFLTLGGMFLGVRNSSKNFGNQNILGCLIQNLFMTLSVSKCQKLFEKSKN